MSDHPVVWMKDTHADTVFLIVQAACCNRRVVAEKVSPIFRAGESTILDLLNYNIRCTSCTVVRVLSNEQLAQKGVEWFLGAILLARAGILLVLQTAKIILQHGQRSFGRPGFCSLCHVY